ncbi:AEC family transporter [Ideonella sp. BN130291]|uniref:AEC family transporter n=1 Tax=Ideonella sp. BN130291 TaxID=3112940 RepID=UPI002E26D6AC|nr:AEC family transporter [Ideonella sp. BN130291]
MTLPVLYKLLAIFIVVALGYIAGRMRWLGDERQGADPARTLSNVAFYVFVPALLFRTTSRLPFATMPWGTLVAFFVPVLMLLLGVYAWQRRRNRSGRLPTAAPSVRAISATFGNTLQVGVPMASALFGEPGLAIHITIISLHALTLLLVLTTLVELDLARAEAAHMGHDLMATLKTTLRNTIIHPVVLPVLAGMAWNATGLPLPPVVDEALEVLGTAVVPLCLVLIGMSLAYYGMRGSVRGAAGLSVLKLLVLPVLVLAVGHWGFGLHGLALNVVVMAAALPVGSNALIFSQRYETLEGEATAAIVLSTFAFVLTAPLWLWVLSAPVWR